VHIGARATVHLVGVLRFSPSIETAKDFFIRNTVSFGEVLKNCGEPSLWVWELLITYCLAIALMYTIIFRFILTFTKKDFLKVTFAVMDREFAIQVLRRSFTTLFADTTSTKRLGQQQVYESFLRSQIDFLFSRKLGGGWGFTLKRSIRRRILKNFMFCIANLIFVFGNCSTGCPKGGT